MKLAKRLAVSGIGSALLGMAGTAAATNGDQMIGVTATQMGMAGAVLAAPQDAATVLYNPAGLAELDIEEVRFDLGVGLLNPTRKVNGFDSDSNLYMMPAGSAAFKISDRAYFGMGLGGISGMGVDFLDTTALDGNQAIVTTKQFFKISPGVGYKLTDELSLGLALNIGYQSLAMYNPSMSLPQNQVYGFGATVGAVYHINDTFRVGLSYASETDMSEFEWNTTAGRFTMDMDQPAQYGIGVAANLASGTLVEFDAKVIEFSGVLDKVALNTPGGTQTMSFGWDDQTVFALGVQQNLGDATKVRVGYNYGKSPIGSEDVMFNTGSMAVVEQHVTLGLTRNFSKRVAGSLSFMHAPNNKVTSDTTPTSIELEQNQLNLQLSYKY